MEVENIKMPPHSIEAEQAVLGSLILSGNEDIELTVPLQAFYRREHQLIYKAILKLLKDKQAIDAVTLSNHLESIGQLHEIGGLAYLGELCNNTPYYSHIDSYATIVQEKYTLRQLVQVSTEISEDALNSTGKCSKQILDTAEQKVFNIANRSSKDDSTHDIREVLALAINKIEERQKNQGAITGLATGFKDLDKLTNGLHPGELIIIAGRPSMGKTSLGMNIAEYASIKSDKCVLVFSMEMSIEDLGLRIISSLGRVDQNKLRTGNMHDADWARTSSAVAALESAKLFIDDRASLTHGDIRAKARRVARETELGLIVIDYLSIIVPPRAENKTAAIAEITRAIKALAKELKVPIILLSQLNRNLDSRPNKRPIMSDLRESGAIEQDADVIMFIYRDEFYNEDSPDRGTAEIIVGKHRNGPIGTINLTFVGHCTRFDNMNDRHLRVVE